MTLRIALVFLCVAGASLSGDDRIRFNQDIRPLLSAKCFQCHGPDEKHRKARLRLDRADGEDGAYRVRGGVATVRPGALAESALWGRITSKDPDEVMPPPGAHKEGALTAAERERIRRWILEGAEYEAFWSFVPLRPRRLPATPAGDGNAAPIDRFVRARLAREGLEPSRAADRRTLIRRVTFDLTGLPPTPEEIERFLADTSSQAYASLVDRLLDRPQYGEHMARYWLDLVRFADTNGLHHDHFRQMAPYRDWVIRAFNENLSFDRFVTDQIAGDLYTEPSTDQLIASGFNRLHLIIDKGTALPEESFTRNVVDRVTAVGTAFLGLTVQCAVCHDHKYDPLTQRDFYQLFAFFNSFDGEPETYLRRGSVPFKRGLHPPFLELPTAEQERQRRRVKDVIARLEKQIERLDEGDKAEDDKTDDSAETESPRLKALKEELALRQKERDALDQQIPAALVMKERAEPRPAHILIRGAYDQPGEQVGRETPAFLPPLRKTGDVATRMDLARWLVAPNHPLTARVAVNRFWQQLFGVGLVKTSEDFGAQGEWPSHPALLDYLALEFVRSDWNVKRLLRSLVLSETYRQSSRADPQSYAADPDNRLLARGARFRLDAEMIRDQLLAVSGLLNPRLYGRSVKPPQPANLWKAVAMPFSYPRLFEPDTGDQIYRRSVYTFWKRALPPPQMTIFDAPTREACVARRERTNTPLQALVLMNEEQYFLAAKASARKLLSLPGLAEEERLSRAYELVTSELPSRRQLTNLAEALRGFEALYASDREALHELTADQSEAGRSARLELAAWTMLVHALFNLDITKTRQ